MIGRVPSQAPARKTTSHSSPLAACSVAIVTPPQVLAGEAGGNLVLVASDAPLPVQALAARAAEHDEPSTVVAREQGERFAGSAPVLTDDDAPVDQLLTPYRAAPR